MNPTPKQRTAALAVAICVPLTAGFEGVRQYVYLDPVKIPTYCFGETSNPQWGKKYSMAECNALLASRVTEFVTGVQRCVRVDLTPYQLAAMGSMAYNTGIAAFCGSSIARYANAGNMAYACRSMNENDYGQSQWVFATLMGVKVKLPGLVNRRAAERSMCEGHA